MPALLTSKCQPLPASSFGPNQKNENCSSTKKLRKKLSVADYNKKMALKEQQELE